MKRRNLICLLMAVLACWLLLAGCSVDTADDEDDSGLSGEVSVDDTVTTDGTQTDDTLTYDIIGEVDYQDDICFGVVTCTVPEDAGDYTALDVSVLTFDGLYEYIYPEEDTVYYLLSDGALVAAAAEDVAVGDLIVQTTADDGEERIIILQKEENAA